VTRWRDRAIRLIARGANPARAADLASGSSYVIQNYSGWRVEHLVVVAVVASIVGAVATVGLAAVSGLRLASSQEAALLEKVENLEGPLLQIQRSELIGRLAVPADALMFTARLLEMSASAQPVEPPNWATRLGQSYRIGWTDAPMATSRAQAFEFVVDFLSRIAPDKQGRALDEWAKFVSVGQDSEAGNLLWRIAILPSEKRDALLRAGFPAVPDTDPQRAVYVMLSSATEKATEACWRAMKGNR
jgi:hypothetical protein